MVLSEGFGATISLSVENPGWSTKGNLAKEITSPAKGTRLNFRSIKNQVKSDKVFKRKSGRKTSPDKPKNHQTPGLKYPDNVETIVAALSSTVRILIKKKSGLTLNFIVCYRFVHHLPWKAFLFLVGLGSHSLNGLFYPKWHRLPLVGFYCLFFGLRRFSLLGNGLLVFSVG